MSQVEVSLCAVFGHKNLSMLIRAHSSRIDVYIWVQLLRCHLKAPCFQKPSQRSRRYSFSQSGYNSACYKYVFSHYLSPYQFSYMLSIVFATSLLVILISMACFSIYLCACGSLIPRYWISACLALSISLISSILSLSLRFSS